MKFMSVGFVLCVVVSLLGNELHAQQERQQGRDHRVHQYHFGSISIPPAFADEPIAQTLSFDRAVRYVEDGAKAWVYDRGCVSCHTTGWYGILRPQLSESLGQPDPYFREFLEERLRETLAEDPEELTKGARPGRIVHLATALASWDAFVDQRLSPQTEQALELMFSLQLDDGAWHSLDCCAPFESDVFQLATVAAMGVGIAPGWLQAASPELQEKISGLREYLGRVAPPHDYARVALLWADQYLPGVIAAESKQDVVRMILDHQRPDGGWSIRSFSEPEKWGGGNRAERLRAEADFGDPPSDGHQTGLALVVLTSAGVPSTHPAMERGIAWLKANQRQSGRWWTKSLNTDTWHFITYTGTLYPVMALTVTGSVPSLLSNRP